MEIKKAFLKLLDIIVPIILVIFLLIFLMFATMMVCSDVYPPSEPFDMSEVPGRYIAVHDGESEYIILYPDLIYKANYKDSLGEYYFEFGDWEIYEYDSNNMKYDIGFSNSYRFVNNKIDEDNKLFCKSKYRTHTYKKWRGSLRIVVHPTKAIVFVKEEGE